MIDPAPHNPDDVSEPVETVEHIAGVTPMNELTDRQLAEETLYWMREAGKAIAAMSQGGMSGILKAMMSGRKG